MSWDFLVSFHSVLFKSWWFSLGWARYLPPGWWVAAALLVTLGALAGLVRRFVVTTNVPDVITFAILVVAVQASAVYWVYFRGGTGPQGRHLFPALIPTLVLMCMGWDYSVPPSWRPRLPAALMLAVAALDLTGWLFLAIPVYGRTGVRTDSPAPVLPGHPLGFRRLVTPELSASVHLGEEFNMYADGLTAIELRPVRVGQPRGMIRLQIGMGTAAHLPSARAVEVPAEEFVRTGIYRFQFTPFGNSKNQHFTLDVAASAENPSSGVALWAIKGVDNAEDTLVFNGEARFGDLVYQTDIVRAPAPPKPPLRTAVWYALAMLMLAWLIAARMLRDLRAAVS
jgi:hypothetical protein